MQAIYHSRSSGQYSVSYCQRYVHYESFIYVTTVDKYRLQLQPLKNLINTLSSKHDISWLDFAVKTREFRVK